MLYIEDFLELIEPFPQELRERLTEMREIDLKIQNDSDKIDDRIDFFFQQCKKQKSEWKIENGEEIKKEYLKLIENADDKLQIANQLYDLLEKYIKKLDQELQKFKLELEADHAGITSRLEQEISTKNFDENVSLNKINSYSSLNLTFNNLNNQTNDDSDFTLCPSSSSDLMQMLNSQNNFSLSENLNNSSNHKRKHSNFSEKSTNLISGGIFGRDDEDSSSSWNSSSLNLNNAIVNFNRKSISSLNKRTFSTSSRQASNLDSNFINIIQNSININNSAIKKMSSSNSIKNKKIKIEKNKLKKTRTSDMDYDDETFEDDENTRNDFYQTDDETNDGTNDDPSEVTSSENGMNTICNDEDEEEEDEEDSETEDEDDDQISEDSEHKFKIPHKNTRNQYTNNHRQFKEEWNSGEDTNERYCICKDISYGDMIMCDNSTCETQWFHFVCVGLNSAPKGKWFCPKCVAEKKKRKDKSFLPLNLNQNTNININNILNTSVNTTTSNPITFTPSTSFNLNDTFKTSN